VSAKRFSQPEFALPELLTNEAWPSYIEGGCNGPSTVSGVNPAWRCYNKQSDITAPSPANLIIHLDERGDSINDASFCTKLGANLTTNPGALEDLPASHCFSCQRKVDHVEPREDTQSVHASPSVETGSIAMITIPISSFFDACG
jgi:hypothetical protein